MTIRLRVLPGLLKAIASDVESKRSASSADDDAELDSLVSPYRVLRNSYVRFGRSSADGLDVDDDQLSNDKRSKHYVRFGRDGRHYVRFGRSSLGALQLDVDGADDDDDDDDENLIAVGSKRAGERHYVRFGRSGEAVEPGTRFKRSSAYGRQYVRYGRAEVAAQRPARTDRPVASKHYVRFGRSGANAATFAADDGTDVNFSDVQSMLSEDDKRSSGKHYVRFGRSQPVVDIDVEEPFGAADNDDSSVDKRSKHYVRFGRSGADDEAEEFLRVLTGNAGEQEVSGGTYR
jgi:hypothetical protein